MSIANFEKEKQETQEIVANIRYDLSSYDVKNSDDEKAVAQLLRQINIVEKTLKEKKKNIVDPINQALKNVRELFKDPEEKVSIKKQEIKDWIDKRINYIEDLQRKKAEEEKIRLEEQNKLLEEEAIKHLENDDNFSFHEAISEIEMNKPLPAAINNPVKVKGAAIGYKYTVHITDVRRLCGAIERGEVPSNIIKLSVSDANKLASAYDGKINIPGCTIKKERVIK